MIQVKQSNVKFKYNDSGNIKYSPLLDLLVVDHQSGYIDQARSKIQEIVNQINNNSSTINNFCNGYALGQNYNIDDYVFYNGEMYRCTQDIQNSTETFPQEKFDKTTIENQLLRIKSDYSSRINNLSNSLSETYSSNKSYQVGDYCIKDNKIYQCFLSVDQSQNEDWETIKNNFRQIKISEQLQKAKSFKIKLSGWQPGGYGVESDEALKRINKGRPSPSSHFLMIACKQGDIFLIKKATSISSTTRGYIFATKDDTYYYTYPNNLDWCAPIGPTEFTNKIVIAPKNAEYLFIHYNNTEVEDWISKDKYATYYINPLTFQIIKILENISSQYSEQKEYDVDDYCLYNGELYRCKNQVINSTWDENDWIKTNIGNELHSSNKTYIDNKIAQISSIINDAQAYAVGTRNGIPITDEDDPIYQRSAREYATNAGGSAAAAYTHLTQAKAWAIGEGINSTHQAYNNNSKYWANSAAISATNAAISAQQAQASKTQVESGIETWLYNNITQQTGYVLDSSLTSQNAAAQAKATGDAITNLQNNTNSAINAITYTNNNFMIDGFTKTKIYKNIKNDATPSNGQYWDASARTYKTNSAYNEYSFIDTDNLGGITIHVKGYSGSNARLIVIYAPSGNIVYPTVTTSGIYETDIRIPTDYTIIHINQMTNNYLTEICLADTFSYNYNFDTTENIWPHIYQVTLSPSAWLNNEQIVILTAVSGNNASQVITPIPDTLSQPLYTSCGVWADSQAEGSLTFKCAIVPSIDLTINIIIQGVIT